MDSSAILGSSDQWSAQSSFFSKLGNYFDRPEWWEEGAETLKAFFDGDTPQAGTTDQRLEDLLDLLEPLKVCEEPSISSNAGNNLDDLVKNTTDLPAFQQRSENDLKHDERQSIELSKNNIQIQAETVDLNTDSSLPANQVNVESAEKEVAPAITNGAQDSQFHSEDPAILIPSSILDINASSDAINTSSPLFTGTTTSTRQISPQPDLSTRASSTIADPAVSFDSSFKNETFAPSPAEAPKAPKLGPFVRNATPNENGIASNSVESTSIDHSTTTNEATTVSEDDPTGLQAVKDEILDEHDLPKAIDSSILTQENDDTVVHDPSAAAVSFFPPNPYSDIPFDSSFYIVHDPSTTHHEELGIDSHSHIDDSSADSTLTSLASTYGQLPESQPVDQVNGRERCTPSPPAFSPLTPPPDFFDTVGINADMMDEVDPDEGDDTQPSAMASTSDQPIPELADVTHEQHAGDYTLSNTNAFNTVNGAVDELAHDNGVDGTKSLTDPLAHVNIKRKQEYLHSDEPAQKKLIVPSTEDGYDSGIKAKAVPITEEEINKGNSRRSVQKGKNKATPRSKQRDSPDELASASPDELADSSASNPFNLNREPQKFGKPKLDRSTTSRSRAKKTTNAPAPLRKLVGVPKFTRGGVGRRELAELLGASPPRTAAEKEKVDIGVRLRSQSRTPAPDSALDPSTAAAVTLVATTIETNGTDTPAQQKRKRPTGSNPVSAQELTDLGNTLILESRTRTRTRTTTVEPTTEPATQFTVKPAPKRTKSAISNAEVERLGAVEMTESRTRNSTAEPTPEPKSAPASTKRAKKPVTKSVAPIGDKLSPFALKLKSKGAPRASQKKEPPRKKAVGPKQDKDSTTGKQTKAAAKRKREEENKEAEEGAMRASKRIAGVQADEQ